MKVWVKAPERRRPRRVAKKIEKREGLLHFKIAVQTQRILRRHPRKAIYNSMAINVGGEMICENFILSCRKNPYPVENLLVFFEFRRRHEENNVVGQTQVRNIGISTVFLGMSAPGGSFFETMIGGGPWDDATFRYETYAEAKATHAEIVSATQQFFDDGSVRSVLAQAMTD